MRRPGRSGADAESPGGACAPHCSLLRRKLRPCSIVCRVPAGGRKAGPPSRSGGLRRTEGHMTYAPRTFRPEAGETAQAGPTVRACARRRRGRDRLRRLLLPRSRARAAAPPGGDHDAAAGAWRLSQELVSRARRAARGRAGPAGPPATSGSGYPRRSVERRVVQHETGPTSHQRCTRRSRSSGSARTRG